MNIKIEHIYKNDILSEIVKSKDGISINGIMNNLSLGDDIVKPIISNLLEQKIISENEGLFLYQIPKNGEIITLKGNLILPVSIIETVDYKYVTRGKWYKLPKDFDTNNIIWVPEIENRGNKNNEDLVDLLITQQYNKPKKGSDFKQLSEYNHLIGATIPYNKNLDLLIKKVGKESTHVHIIINLPLYNEKDSSIQTVNKTFVINSEISTNDMLSELQKPKEERNYQNISFNSIIEYNDMILTGNEIPIEYTKNYIKFVKITSLKNGIKFQIISKSIESSYNISVNIEDDYSFDTFSEAIGKIVELTQNTVNNILIKYDIILDKNETL